MLLLDIINDKNYLKIAYRIAHETQCNQLPV